MKKLINSKAYESLDDLCNDYLNQGYVSIKNLLDLNILNDFASELTSTLADLNNNNKSFSENVLDLDKNNRDKLYDFHNKSQNLFSLQALSKEIYIVLKFLNKNKSINALHNAYLLGIPKDKRLTYDFHQEGNYMKDLGHIYNIHFPIFQKSNENNGTMSLLIGSDKEGLLPFNKKRLSNDSYTDLVPKNIESLVEKYDEGICELEVGDCLIFNEKIVHKSNYNNSDLCRTVGVWRALSNFDKNQNKQLKPDEL